MLKPLWAFPKRESLILHLAVVVLCSLSLSAGEKIQITEGTDKAEFPNKSYGKDPLSESFNPLKREQGGKGSLMPIMPAPSQRSMERSGKTSEKDWATSGRFDRDAVLKEIFQIRDYGAELKEQKQTEGQRWWGRGSEQKNNSTRDSDKSDRQPNEYGKSPKPGSYAYEADQETTTPSSMELNPNGLLLPNQSNSSLLGGMTTDPTRDLFNPGRQGKAGSIFDRTGSSQASRPRDREAKSEDFEKVLGTRKFLVDQFNDPILFQADKTRQSINPVVGSRFEPTVPAAPSGALTSPINVAGGVHSGDNRRFFDPIDSKVLGISSLAPAVVMPANTPSVMQAKPPGLEIPKRKF